MRSMHVVSRSGRVTAGFDAVRSIVGRLPLFWPLAVVGLPAGGRMAGPSRVQSGCGHSAARRSLHRSSLRDPLSNAAQCASRPRPRSKPPQRDRDAGRLPGVPHS